MTSNNNNNNNNKSFQKELEEELEKHGWKSIRELNPYHVLGLVEWEKAFNSSNNDNDNVVFPNRSEIEKAYRKMALKHHPDKQKKTKKESSSLKKFQEIQQAKEWLLGESTTTTNFERLNRYLQHSYKKSRHLHQREEQLSKRRRELQIKLKQKEQEAISSTQSKKRTSSQNNELLNHLRQQNKRRKQAYEEKQQQQEEIIINQDTKPSSSIQKRDCQVRIKWSRKRWQSRMQQQQQESMETLIQQELVDRFGPVESFEIVDPNKKAHVAIVTFVSSKSVTPCVEYYQDSKYMRATRLFVETITRTNQEQEQQQHSHIDDDDDEQQGDLNDQATAVEDSHNEVPSSEQGSEYYTPFPLEFPVSSSVESSSWMQRLQDYEAIVFGTSTTTT